MSDPPKSKLQREYDEINDPNSKTLEEQEKVEIDKYQMKQGDYKILITIYQAQELQPKKPEFLFFEMNKTACDPFVEVEIRGQKRKTAIKKQTNNPIWQQSFYYPFENLTVQDLDNSKIIFNVYDHNNIFLKNSHVGQIQLDWTNIYFRRFHQIYRGWLTLSDPDEENQGVMGYLLVNIAVLGPEDKVMVHDTAFIKDPLTTIEDTITNTKIKLIDYSITVEVYRAENLIPLDLAARSVDAFVVAKFSGNKVQTPKVRRSLNPEWNTALKIGTGVPTKTKYLTLEVWNHNYFSKNDLIGTLKIPFVDICYHKYTTPRWGHLYGPPMCAIDQAPSNYASKMQLYGQELGSHYRGRILYKIVGKRYVHSTTGKTQIKFKFPYKPTPVVALKTYTLSLEMIEGFHLPQRPQAFIQVAMGQYLIKTSRSYQVQKRLCEFHDILEDKKVQFPQDIQQVPDIIIYFCDGIQQKNRMAFVRIKASQVQTLLRNKQSKILTLQGDKSLHLLKNFELGGYLNCRVNLYTDGAPAVKTIESELIDKTFYQLSLYIFKGEDFPPAKIEGYCDPVLKFNCFGSTKNSSVKKGTFNPIWGQDVHIDKVNMQDLYSTSITKAVVVQAFDHVDGENKDQFIGSFYIELNNTFKQIFKQDKKQETTLLKSGSGINNNQSPIEFIYVPPKWYYIVNPHIQVGKNIFGRVLIGAALFKQEDINLGRIPRLYYDYKFREEEKKNEKEKEAQLAAQNQKEKSVKPKSKSNTNSKSNTQQKKYKRALIEYQSRSMQVYVIGLRQIRDSSKTVLTKGDVDLIITIGDKKFEMLKNGLKRSGCQINKLIELDISIPKNKYLIPFMDFSVKYNGRFYGYNSANLYKMLPKLKQKQGQNNNNVQNQGDSQDTILDVEGLQRQLQMLRQKKKKDLKEKLQGKLYAQEDQQENIADIKAPGQLVVLKKENINSKDQQKLQQLLDQVKTDIQNNEDYRYVKQLQSLKDTKQAGKKRVSGQIDPLGQLVQNQGANEQQIQAIEQQNNQDDQESKMNPKAKSSNKQGSQSHSRANICNIKKTVFELRQEKLLRSKAKLQTKKGEDSKAKIQKQKQKSQQKSMKKERESQKPPQPSGPKMIEQEKQIKVEIKSQNALPEHESQADKKRRSIELINNIESVRGDFIEVSTRYNNDGSRHDRLDKIQENQEDSAKTIAFEIKTEQNFKDDVVNERAITYQQVKRAMDQEAKDEKQAKERDAEYKYAQAVKLSLFGWTRKKRRKNVQTYEDFDTQPGEDLNIIPEWYKGRKILTSDFEDLNFKSTKIQTIPLYGGRPLQNTTIYQRYKQPAGHVKLICLSEPQQVARQKQEQYTKLLKPRQFYCRIYCLKGKSLISHYQGKPTTYLRFSYADQTYSFQKIKKCQKQNNPQYYICQQIQINLPGPSVIKIEVIEEHNILKQLNTIVLGFTEIDIEQRYFTRKWHLYEKKPIELRNLYSEFGIGTQGRLQTWIDLIEKKNWISTPAHKIHPPPFDKYELRVIVWKTDDCVYKNVEMESNDIFVRGVIGTSEPQQTDTHWACRTVGNFNYRFKFPVNYPPKPQDMYSDIFAVQIWDRDLIGFNNLIGQTRINLNKIHKIIQKAVKRRKPVQASMKIKQKNFAVTDRFWFDVFNHKEKDQFGIPQPQGRVQLSFQLVPIQIAEDSKKNGFGRSEPNVYPTLADPEGRLQFDFFSPLAFLKQILGPNLYRKCCCKLICCILILLIGFFGYIFFPTLIAVKI